uniref:Surface-adhesin protein E-like domain-containing protein n=1 Tax=Polynucleobacter necessarius subsp. necessarius (strain STIR1) TaxID=452638 RepID=B1XUD7_POLNS
MKKLLLIFALIYELCFSIVAYSYPLPIIRFEDEGSLYVESTSIVKNARYTSLTYVENFNQPRNFGELPYLSKATDVRIDCPSRRVFGLREYYYEGADRTGRLLGKFSMDDQYGADATRGSWVSEMVHLGCDPR